ncbi:MAG TPA: phosphatase PAP2 family protein [Lysobacter sp.]|nr:phosphatase PAP2 family protein [Lysobacter sp.]
MKEARFGAAFLRRYGLRLLLLFIGVLLPLWGFAELADEVREGEPFVFDEPILRFAHNMATSGFDQTFLMFSALGYQWGVVPFDFALVLILAIKRRAREGLFAGLALGGSALLNLTTKQLFARERPSLWESIAPETTFSFPSGHAMGSMTLAWVCLLLTWRTPWRWPVAAAALTFTTLVGLSRVYLGVHYPSDILAGWTAASVWAVCCFFTVFQHHRHPWQLHDIPATA